jgi:hypothetical protein
MDAQQAKLDELRAEADETPNLLFLLVGDNPLPNYVAARLLSGAQTTIVLIHSESTATRGTGEQRDRLEQVLQGYIDVEGKVPFQAIRAKAVEESNATHITEVVSACAQEGKQPIIHLHYTGGTKAMATHAYNALRALRRADLTIHFSYLDARSLCLWIEAWPTATSTTISSTAIKVNERLALKLETLLALHGRKASKVRRSVLLPQTAQAIAQLRSDQANDAPYLKWIYRTFFLTPSDAQRRLWAKLSEFGSHSVAFDPALKDIHAAIDADLGAGTYTTWQEFVQQAERVFPEYKGSTSLKQELGKWFEGKWIESYLASEMASMGDVIASISLSKSGNFEFDVALMRGYQLFAISCTTEHQYARCKSKLLEAYARAQQLGGSEARVGIFSFVQAPDPSQKLSIDERERLGREQLRTEIEGLLDDQRIEIFIRDDLPVAGEKIADWIRRSG